MRSEFHTNTQGALGRSSLSMQKGATGSGTLMSLGTFPMHDRRSHTRVSYMRGESYWNAPKSRTGLFDRSGSAAHEQRHTPWTKTRLGSMSFPPSTWETSLRTAKNWPPVNTSAAPNSGAKSRRICRRSGTIQMSDTSRPAEDTDMDAPSRACATRGWDSGPSAMPVLRGCRRRPCRNRVARSQGCRGWRRCSGNIRRR